MTVLAAFLGTLAKMTFSHPKTASILIFLLTFIIIKSTHASSSLNEYQCKLDEQKSAGLQTGWFADFSKIPSIAIEIVEYKHSVSVRLEAQNELGMSFLLDKNEQGLPWASAKSPLGDKLVAPHKLDLMLSKELDLLFLLTMGGDSSGFGGFVGKCESVKADKTNLTSRILNWNFPGTLTTNLKNSRKFLQIGVGVSGNETSIAAIKTHQLSLRSTFLGVMSEFEETSVIGQTGREALTAELLKSANAALIRLGEQARIKEVHLTNFTLQ